jgi:hypothetical protein
MAETNDHTTTNGAQEGPAKETDPWRDEKGRFLPGNPGGPGNPHVREMARLRAEWRQATPGAVLKTVQGHLLGLALKGSLPALRLWLQYIVGRPDKSVDLDELPLHELELAIKQARLMRQAKEAGAEVVPTPAPPPSGRPEAEWRRAEPEPRRAEPPPGSSPLDQRGLILRLISELHALGAADSLARVSAWVEAQAGGGQTAQVETVAVYKRGQTAGDEEGPPVGEAAPEPR